MLSETAHLGSFQLKLELVRDKGDELTIRRFSLGIADGIAEKSLQGIQIPSVPGYFDGMTNRSFHPGRCSLECLGYLGIQYLGDGVDDVHIVDGDDNRLPQILVAFNVSWDADQFICLFMA